MTVIPAWDNPNKTILRYIHYGNWTWEEVDQAVEKAQVMFKQAEFGVHVIIDLRETGSMPAALPAARRPLYIAPSKNHMLILLGPGALCQSYYETASLFYQDQRPPECVAYLDLIEDARTMLSGVAA